jgi:hypothetical protein
MLYQQPTSSNHRQWVGFDAAAGGMQSLEAARAASGSAMSARHTASRRIDFMDQAHITPNSPRTSGGGLTFTACRALLGP